MSTVLDLITRSLGDIGYLSAGEAPAAAEATEALAQLNGLLDQWKAERLTIPNSVRTLVPLTASLGEYAFGGAAAAPRQTITDGFDSDWVPSDSAGLTDDSPSTTAPPNWTMTGVGSYAAVKDTVDYQAGGAALRLFSDLGDSLTAHRDFPVHSGEQVTLSIWLRGSTALDHAIVRVYNPDTAKYLTGLGAWQTASADLFDSVDTSFTRYWITFSVEALAAVGDRDTRLRVILVSEDDTVYFDTLQLDLSGPASSVPIPKPAHIDHINLLDTASDPDYEMPLRIYTDDEWAAIPQKSLTSTYPSGVYYNRTHPNGTLSLWPVPTGSGLKLVLYVPTAVNTFPAITTEVNLPPGYERMIVKNLAIELCPSFNRQPSPLLVKQAGDSMSTVKRSNVKVSEMCFEAGALIGTRPVYDIRRG